MTDAIVGYFVWTRGTKGPVPIKHDSAMRDQAMPETKKRQDENQLQIVSLTKEDWALTLDELIAKYPAPAPAPVVQP